LGLKKIYANDAGVRLFEHLDRLGRDVGYLRRDVGDLKDKNRDLEKEIEKLNDLDIQKTR
jgi:hypothetical protein